MTPEHQKYVNIVVCENAGKKTLLTTVEEEQEFDTPWATPMLAIFVRGITSRFEYAYAHFTLDGLTSGDLVSKLAEAMQTLECIGFKVLAITARGLKINRMCFRMMADDGLPCAYKCRNKYTEEDRPIYFLIDAPHLLKAVCNSLTNSKLAGKPRAMWRNHKNIVWDHIVKAYEADETRDSLLTRKLARNRTEQNLGSRVRARLSAEIINSRTAETVEEIVASEASETVMFLRVFGKYFDILNARACIDRLEKGDNSDVLPISRVNDDRIEWMKEEFLPYLKGWKAETLARKGTFSRFDRKTMFLNAAAYEGLKIMTHSMLEIVNFLLGKGAEEVLTEHFSLPIQKQECGRPKSATESSSIVQELGDDAARLIGDLMVQELCDGAAESIGDPIVLVSYDGDAELDVNPIVTELGDSATRSDAILAVPESCDDATGSADNQIVQEPPDDLKGQKDSSILRESCDIAAGSNDDPIVREFHDGATGMDDSPILRQLCIGAKKPNPIRTYTRKPKLGTHCEKTPSADVENPEQSSECKS